jgi:hypothetical protein
MYWYLYLLWTTGDICEEISEEQCFLSFEMMTRNEKKQIFRGIYECTFLK